MRIYFLFRPSPEHVFYSTNYLDVRIAHLLSFRNLLLYAPWMSRSRSVLSFINHILRDSPSVSVPTTQSAETEINLSLFAPRNTELSGRNERMNDWSECLSRKYYLSRRSETCRRGEEGCRIRPQQYQHALDVLVSSSCEGLQVGEVVSVLRQAAFEGSAMRLQRASLVPLIRAIGKFG
ncbi:hypothetical protein BT96DRAFT_242743 [Gymnopus androsaceus JB14]|uniref:Uncharacterized protein n=1 Tax=Gymnopus androsaceus JB14 TaxID=1447944 RepID=A0A6A4IJW9_9AGAR|nr:hypothetical protein BT96DRAFT_242743 [Gymnopus androsaceus JB14]